MPSATCGFASREAAKEFDWRYYITKHPEMRGTSGIYVGNGYSLCMLFGTRVSGYYWDPYLLAVLRKSSACQAQWLTRNRYQLQDGPPVDAPHEKRHELRCSGNTGSRCVRPSMQPSALRSMTSARSTTSAPTS